MTKPNAVVMRPSTVTVSPEATTVLAVDFASDPRPKYLVLESAIRAAVAAGRLAPGTKLPPVRDLSWRVGVTPGTVARVYRMLTDAGILEAAVGRGTFVAAPRAPERGLAEPERAGTVNLRTSQVVDVGQAARIAAVMARVGPSPEGYGTYPVRESDAAVREALARWLLAVGSRAIAADDMVLTLGAQHAVVVLMQALLAGPRPIVVTEELAYPGFRHAAGLVRADLRGLAMDAEGACPEALERAAQAGAQMFVTSSEAHNPTTIRTSPERRRALAAIATHYGMEIVDDDCFALTADGPDYRDCAAERAWLVTSLSKTISPALRLGMIGAPPGRADTALVAAQQQFFGLPRPQLDLVQTLVETGEAAAIRADVSAKQGARIACARDILGEFDIATRDEVPFAWLRPPRGWRSSSLLRATEARGVMLKAADEFALIDGHAPNAVRLALNGTLTDARFEDALRTVADILRTPPREIDT